MRNNKVFFTHGEVQRFIARRGYTLKTWLNDSHIKYEQNGDNYYVVDDTGRRTGEVYSLLNVIPTDEPLTID